MCLFGSKEENGTQPTLVVTCPTHGFEEHSNNYEAILILKAKSLGSLYTQTKSYDHEI